MCVERIIWSVAKGYRFCKLQIKPETLIVKHANIRCHERICFL